MDSTKMKDSLFATNSLFSFQKSADEIMSLKDPLNNRLKLCNFIKYYFDYAFCLGISPFRIVRRGSSTSPYFTVKTNRIQQVLCSILHILCVIRLIAEVRQSNFGKRNKPHETNMKDPTYYFNMALSLLILSFKVATFKRFWWNQQGFVQVLNFIVRENRLPVLNLKILNVNFCRILYAVYASLAVSGLPVGKHFVKPIQSWTPTVWFEKLVATARYAFFLGDRSPGDEYSVLEYFISILMAFVMLTRYLMGFFGDLCVMTMTLTLWATAYSFDKSIVSLKADASSVIANIKQVWVTSEKEKAALKFSNGKGCKSAQDWPVVYSQHKAIRDLAGVINQALGNLVTFYLAESLMFYSIHCNDVIVTSDYYQRLNLVFFYINIFSVLLLASDICHRVNAIRKWLESVDNISSIPSNEMNLVLLGLVDRTVGIQGNERFTVTYSVVVTFCTLIVTYFIICVEYKY